MLEVNITKKLRAFTLDVNFKADNNALALLGQSGSGKSMTLKCIAGVEKPDSGKIVLDGEILYDSTQGICLPPQKRRIGLLFQNYALFPNMTVFENVEYALKLDKNLKDKSKEIAQRTLEQIGMMEHADKKPRQLSGGQQQRVAIARTLALNPKVILLDEPISALDVTNREIMKKELKDIQRKFNSTMIFITHEQEEAFYLSDRIMVMSEGKIEQLDTPKNIYDHPANQYIKDFVVAHLDHKFESLLKCTGRSL